MPDEVKGAEVKDVKGGLPKWLGVVIGLVIVAAIVIVWSLTKTDTASNTDTKEEPVKEDVSKHPDWSVFTAKKYSFTILHPKDYTVTESAVGNLVFSNAAGEIVDMYVTSAEGSNPESAMASQERNITNDDMKIMITDSVVQKSIAGITAKQAIGVFGDKGGINLSHDGVAGSIIFFIEDEKMFVFDSYDKGDPATRLIFEDMVDSIQF